MSKTIDLRAGCIEFEPGGPIRNMKDNQKKSILCPNCRRLISMDERQCPYCGVSRPGSWWNYNAWTNGFRKPDQLIKLIIYVNSAMFFISLILSPHSLSLSANPLSLLSPDNTSLLVLGASGAIPFLRLHRWWTLLSANYLHAGILHILFNMIALWQIGFLVIQEYGAFRMFAIYTLSGAFGFWVSSVVGVPFTLGASAAVCGMIGAALYYGKSRGGAYGQAIYSQVGGWALTIFIFGFLVPGINNWAHGSGLAAGAFLGFVLGYGERKRENLSHKVLAGACAVLTALVLGYSILFGVAGYFSG